jgi:hypothetical protein
MEPNMRQGIYRIRGVGDLPNDVRVDDDGISVPLEESLYRARGHQPSVDDLPWRDDYFRQQEAERLEAAAGEATGVSPLKPRSAALFSRYRPR